ncbi:ABC transporter substrate-binding protein [Candidatus Halobeggiatoa sp. HSG11]|nr:ABC transporter substrate-binding protein [Candidatus Halobeggiatoa sp. HSG11]
MKKSYLLLLFKCLLLMPLAQAQDTPLLIYLDADRSHARESGIAIERGIRTALDEINYTLAGHRIALKILDHRGNSRRSHLHLKQFIADPKALAVFCGLHSPPLLANLQFINENEILMLDPWAAAGPITRYQSDKPTVKNFVFRLSIDDSKAGTVLIHHAIKRNRHKQPHLLLEKTGWGRSNHRTMLTALQQLDKPKSQVTWFDWGIRKTAAKIVLREIVQTGADVIMLVANAPEAKVFVKAMLELAPAQRLPIVSHWGLTGGDFPQVINADMRSQLGLEFIQTSFSFLQMDNNPFAQQVFQHAQSLFPELKTPADLKAATGFIHAYDLTRLFIKAVEQTGLTGDKQKDKNAIRLALENLQQPVQGLLKTYHQPFSTFSANNPDAHEALGINDFVLGHYGRWGEVILLPE